MVQAAARSPEVPQAYRTHPLLDPRLPSHDPGLARVWLSVWRKLLREPDASGRMVASYARPAGSASQVPLAMAAHYRDADLYLDDLLRLVPDSLSRHLEPLARTRRLNAMIDLFHAVFEGTDARVRYEAQRKLYLGKLLFDIEHCRSVHDGPHHRQCFESALSEGLWSGMEEGAEVEICCRLSCRPGDVSRQGAGGRQIDAVRGPVLGLTGATGSLSARVRALAGKQPVAPPQGADPRYFLPAASLPPTRYL